MLLSQITSQRPHFSKFVPSVLNFFLEAPLSWMPRAVNFFLLICKHLPLFCNIYLHFFRKLRSLDAPRLDARGRRTPAPFCTQLVPPIPF